MSGSSLERMADLAESHEKGRPAVVIPSIRVADALQTPGAVVIDLRSPQEFAEDHLPGAHNVPLFDDLERKLIGTLFHRTSPQAAFDEGLRRTRQHVAALTADIARIADWTPPGAELVDLVNALSDGGVRAMEGALQVVPVSPPERPVVLHCWRGGMRSRSVVALMRALGLERAVLLQGGYKATRQFVRETIEAWQAPPAYVLRGLTGVGKTLVLRALERRCPGWTLDLEGAAGHRSSILGMVGLKPLAQKPFESRLCTRLRAGFPAGLVVFEGESRKVGDAIVPEAIWRALRTGTPLELVASISTRVEVLLADYLANEENRAPLARQLPFIEARLGPVKWRGVLVAMLAAGRDAELVEVLLERYYDPLYEHSEKRFLAERAQAGLPAYVARFDTSDADAAAAEIAAWIARSEDRQSRDKKASTRE